MHKRNWMPRKRKAKTETKLRGSTSLPDFELSDLVSLPGEPSAACGTLTWYTNAVMASPQTPFLNQAPGSQENNVPVTNVTSPVIDHKVLVRQAFRTSHEGLVQFAQASQLRPRDLACTLLGLLLNVDTGELAVGQVGDGLILALHLELGARRLIETPIPGDPGETYTVTQTDWEEYFASASLTAEQMEGIKTLYVMTDGVSEDCLYPPPVNITERWARDIDRELRKGDPPARSATRLLRWLAQYEAPGSFDDRTLVVLMR